MTALKGRLAEAFVKKRDPAIGAALIYGPDAGLVKERADALARTVTPDFKDPFNYLEFSETDLKGEPGRLADEAAALSFIGGERVIRLRTSGDAAFPAAKLLVDGLDGGHVKSNALVLIEAGALAKTARLRKLFEAAKHAVALPCYEDSPEDVRRLAVDVAAADGLVFDDDALEFVVSLLGEDRALSRAELDKLVLYVGPEADNNAEQNAARRITLADAQASLADTAREALDEASAAAADGASGPLAAALYRSAGAGANPVALLRALQRQFGQLNAARGFVDAGASPADAVKKVRPPIFFSAQRAFAGRLHRWPTRRLETALDLLLKAEIETKATGAPQREIVERAAFRLAAMAARR